jgi:hypothetical protein
MENLGVKGTQSINRLKKRDTGFFARAFLLGIRARLHHLESGSSVVLKDLVKRRFGSSPSIRAQSHERGVQSNTCEPRRKP